MRHLIAVALTALTLTTSADAAYDWKSVQIHGMRLVPKRKGDLPGLTELQVVNLQGAHRVKPLGEQVQDIRIDPPARDNHGNAGGNKKRDRRKDNNGAANGKVGKTGLQTHGQEPSSEPEKSPRVTGEEEDRL